MGLGDLTTQTLFPEGNGISLARTAQFSAFSFFASGPALHFFYKFMESSFPGQTSKQVLKKVVVDQVFLAPTMLSLFLFYLGAIEHKSVDGGIEKWKKDIGPGLQGNYVLWPAANFVGYKYVPVAHRVAYVAAVSFFWSIYLSYVSHRNSPAK